MKRVTLELIEDVEPVSVTLEPVEDTTDPSYARVEDIRANLTFSPEGGVRRRKPITEFERQQMWKTAQERSPEIAKAVQIGPEVATGGLNVWLGGARYAERFGVPKAKNVGDFLDTQIKKIQQHSIPSEDRNFFHDLANAGGSMVSLVGPSLTVANIASKIITTSPRLANVIASVVATGLESAMEAGSVYDEMKKRGFADAEAKKAADVTAGLNAVLVGLTNKLGIFGDKAKGFRKLLMSSVMEGLQEAGQSSISDWSKGDKIDWRQAGYEGLIGATLGGFTGAVVGGVRGDGIQKKTVVDKIQPVTLTPVEDILAEGEKNKQEYIASENAKRDALIQENYNKANEGQVSQELPVTGQKTAETASQEAQGKEIGQGLRVGVGGKTKQGKTGVVVPLGEVVGYNAKDGKPIIDIKGGEQYDKENKAGLSGGIKTRETTIQTEPVQEGGGKETKAGGILQTQKEVKPKPIEGGEQVETPPAEPLVPKGNISFVKTDRGTKVKVQYAVVDANDIQASHDTALNKNKNYPQELQPRQRERAASEMQINNILGNLEPEFLAESPRASDGAPIVGKDLIVESGNGRIIAIKKGYETKNQNTERYKNWLIENAERFGIDKADIEGIKNPVLVRIRQSDVDRVKFVQEANEQSIASMSASEQARLDSKNLTSAILSLFNPNESGEINTAGNRDFISAFLNKVVAKADVGRLVTPDGYLSQDGVRRVKNAILAKAYEDSAIIEKLSESTDDNIRNVTNALVAVGPRLAVMKERIQSGDLYDFDISNDIAQAALKLSSLRESGQSVDDYLKQNALFDDGVSSNTKILLKVFDEYKRSGKRIKNILNNYIDLVEKLGNPKQEDMLGNPSVKDILQEAIIKEGSYEETDNQASIWPTSKTVSDAATEKVRQDEQSKQTQKKEAVEGNQKEKDELGDVSISIGRESKGSISVDRIATIVREIERIAAPDTRVEVKNRIELSPEQLSRALQQWSSGNLNEKIKIRGSHRIVEIDGNQFRSLIELSLENMDPNTTPYHEAFHSVQKFLLTNEEMARLNKRFPAKDGVSSKERQADAFARYVNGMRNMPVWARNSFEKIKSFLKSIRDFIQGKGWSYNDVTDIFEKAYTGELKQRYKRGGDLGLDVDLDVGERVENATERLMQKIGITAAENVTLVEREKRLGIVKALLASPSKIAGKVRYYVVHGKNALHKQDRLRGIADAKMKEIFKPLKNKALMAEFEAISWMGDMEGKTYTAEELDEIGVSSAVKDAYLKHRKFHEQVWKLLSAHRKAYGLETGHREGHIPHLFENWNVYEMKDEVGEDGEVRQVPAGIGTFRSLMEATAFANSLDPNKNYLIKPKTFSMPDELIAKTALKDTSYFKLVERLESVSGMSREEAFDAVNEIAKRKNRHRLFGNLMKRKGQTGFRQDDLQQILKEYYYSVARYVVLDDFKARVIPKFEKDFGVEFGKAEEAVRDKSIARYVEEYINDVNGVPGKYQELIDNTIKYAFGKYIRSERPTIWTANKLMHFTAVTKLGLLNLSAGLVNITQLLNTFSKLPLQHFAWAFERVVRTNIPLGISRGLRHIPYVGGFFKLDPKDAAILRRIGIEYDLGLSDTGGYSMTHKGRAFVRGSMYFFTKAEYINRAITALAAYRYARKDLGMSEKQARIYAREMVDNTQFDYSVADTAQIFRSPQGRLLGQFKPFAIKQIEFILGLKGAEKIKFWIPILMLAGAGGIPLAEGLSEFIEWLTGKNPLLELKAYLARWAGDDKDKKRVAEIALYGVGSQLGIDISRRVGLGDVMPKRASDLLGPTINTLMQAKKILEKGDKTELARTIAPSIGNLVTAIETAINDMEVRDPWRRQHLKYEASQKDVVTKGLGLRPLKEAKLSDIEQIRQYETQKYTKLQRKYVDKALDSLMDGDADGFAEAITKAAEKGVIIDSRAIENEILQRVLPQDVRMLLKTRAIQRGDYMQLMEFPRED